MTNYDHTILSASMDQYQYLYLQIHWTAKIWNQCSLSFIGNISVLNFHIKLFSSLKASDENSKITCFILLQKFSGIIPILSL